MEVGPRDGLQNEPGTVSTQTRVSLIDALSDAGLRNIECGSFVSPKWVPQMANTQQVFSSIRRVPNVSYSALVPNLRGFEEAVQSNVSEVAVFLSASESFSQANINCSIEESLRRAEEVLGAATLLSIPVRGYVSCVLGCPFSGEVPASNVARVAQALAILGCYEISLGDTIGVGTPLKAQRMLDEVAQSAPLGKLAVHYHDTWGQGLANILASLAFGIAVVDSAVAGLGGCPYAPGATGNVATEDVVYMLDGMGVETGVDLRKVADAGHMISSALGRRSSSKAARALEASRANK